MIFVRFQRVGHVTQDLVGFGEVGGFSHKGRRKEEEFVGFSYSLRGYGKFDGIA